MSTIKQDVVNELHKQARKNFKRRKVLIRGLNDLYQADLVEMQPFSKLNKGHRYILTVLNTFSKYLWAIPLKNKTASEVTSAMEGILKKLQKNPKHKQRIPKNLQTDDGTEFKNKHFKNLMTKYGINHYSTYSNLKASIVERANRTLKERMWKKFSLQGNYKWLDILQQIVNEYNNTKHSVIGMKPNQVSKKNEKKLLLSVFNPIKILDPHSSKFKLGDSVRISKHREKFSRGYTPSWSNEIFKIKKIKRTFPITYILEDQKQEEIRGCFYKEELQKVKHKDVYLVEKVIKRKPGKMFVKYLGMDKSHNAWISKDKLV